MNHAATASAAAQLTVVVPALFAVFGLVFGHQRSWAASWGRAGALGAFVAACAEAYLVLTWRPVYGVPLLGTADLGIAKVNLQLRADELSAVVAVAVGLVALCVQVYSTGYFGDHDSAEHPARYTGYASAVSLFTAAMMLVVHADDLLVLLIGWEVMGACSYLLVGHHSERQAARAAAVKAFLVTRTGDVGIVLAVATLLVSTRTTSISTINALATGGELSRTAATAAALFALVAVVGKSAQVPLQTWLPDAMEGPTPVSALIHAATMVAAGVFLVARLLPVFLVGSVALSVAAVIASVTMVMAAFAALAQDDLKRLLAWSTVSQVAYMLAGISLARDADGAAPAIFHLLTHAAFKGLLFLVAGVLIALYGTTSMAAMGGLRRSHPSLAGLFALGLAALAGIVPLSGFWSKEIILSVAEVSLTHTQHSSYASATDPRPQAVLMLVLGCGLLTTLITGMYAARAYVLVAGGEPRDGMARTDVPTSMRVPLWILAVPTAFGGLMLALPPFNGWVPISGVTAIAGTVLAVVGALWAASAARLGTPDIAVAIPERTRQWLRAGYRLDAVQQLLIVRPYRWASRVVAAGDHDVIDAYPRATAVVIRWAGRGMRWAESGVVTGYAGWVFVGALLLGVLGVVLT